MCLGCLSHDELRKYLLGTRAELGLELTPPRDLGFGS